MVEQRGQNILWSKWAQTEKHRDSRDTEMPSFLWFRPLGHQFCKRFSDWFLMGTTHSRWNTHHYPRNSNMRAVTLNTLKWEERWQIQLCKDVEKWVLLMTSLRFHIRASEWLELLAIYTPSLRLTLSITVTGFLASSLRDWYHETLHNFWNVSSDPVLINILGPEFNQPLWKLWRVDIVSSTLCL